MKRLLSDIGPLFIAIGFVFALNAAGCASHMPPGLTPQAQVQWTGTKVIHAIDPIRDLAQDGTKTTPPVISEATATKVTQWHKAAVLTIQAAPLGWQAGITTGLTELVKSLPATERQQLEPYVSLAITVLKEVAR